MTKYTISTSFDKKDYFWIVIENGKIINRNPNKEDIIGIRIMSYNNTNICLECRKKNEKDGFVLTDKSILYPGNAIHEKDNDGKETGEYICKRCYTDYYNRPISRLNSIDAYKSKRIIDGKATTVVVDKSGKIINRCPSKNELKELGDEPRKLYDTRMHKQYTDKALLNYPILFEKEHGRPPTGRDFSNNHGYPSVKTCTDRFGTWLDFLKLAGLNIDVMGRQGDKYRGRQAEITVFNHFEQHPTDLSGENMNSSYDGICPNGKIYDVKSSKLYDGKYCDFHTNNKDKDDIEIYYLLAINDDGTIRYVLRIPGEMAEKDHFYVGTSHAEFTFESMKEYDITNKFKYIFKELF